MPKFSFTRYRSDIPELERVQDQIESIVAALNEIPFLDGILTESQFIDNSLEHQVPHNLERAPEGVFIIENDSNTTVRRIPDANTSTQKNSKQAVLVQASGDCTVKLWVF